MRYTLLILALFVCTTPVLGQSLGEPAGAAASTTAYYRHAERGDITVQVNVWGAVRNPGMYEIARGTHVNTLLTLTGGPPIGITTVGGPTRVSRTLHLRLVRAGNDPPRVVFESVMKDGILLSQENPTVEQGDYLIIEVTEHQRQSFTWRDGLTVTTAIAAVALAIERIIGLF